MINTCYHTGTDILSKKFMYKYSGVLLSGNCSWNAHVDHVVGKTAVALNYIQRNLVPANSNLRNIVHLRGIDLSWNVLVLFGIHLKYA